MVRRTRGFTLVEMIVTLTIMSVLAMAALPLGETVQQHAREKELRRALVEIRQALDAFKSATDTGRIGRATESGYPPDLQTLVDGVEDTHDSNKRVYFLRQIPRDPYCPPDTPDARCWALRAYESPPDDPKPGDDVFDVHSKSDLTGSDGRPYRRW